MMKQEWKKNIPFDTLLLFFPEVRYCYSGGKFCPLFWKLLVSEFLHGISDTIHCSAPAHVKIVLLLDVCQLPMLFVGMLKYLQPGMFL
jgi:hypothetical protein